MSAYTINTHGTISKFANVDEANYDVQNFHPSVAGLEGPVILDHFPEEEEYLQHLQRFEILEIIYSKTCEAKRASIALKENLEARIDNAPNYEYNVSDDIIELLERLESIEKEVHGVMS